MQHEYGWSLLTENLRPTHPLAPKNGAITLCYAFALLLCTSKPAILVHFLAVRNSRRAISNTPRRQRP